MGEIEEIKIDGVDDNKIFFIYAYQHKTEGKIYIGQTEDIERRDYEHSRCADSSMNIDKAIKEHGRHMFDFWIVCIVDTWDQVNQEEIYWIAEMRKQIGWDNVYNISDGGAYGMRGKTHTPETKKIMSESAMGKPGTNLGKTFDEDWKLKMSKSMVGKVRKGRRRFSEEVEKQICDLYVMEEKSTYALGKQFNVNRSLIIEILNRGGIVRRKSNYTGHFNGRNRFTKNKELEICEIYKTGKVSLTFLANKYETKTNVISAILVRHGIDYRIVK